MVVAAFRLKLKLLPCQKPGRERDFGRNTIHEIDCATIVFGVKVKVHSVINESVYIAVNQCSNFARASRKDFVVGLAILIAAYLGRQLRIL